MSSHHVEPISWTSPETLRKDDVVWVFFVRRWYRGLITATEQADKKRWWFVTAITVRIFVRGRDDIGRYIDHRVQTGGSELIYPGNASWPYRWSCDQCSTIVRGHPGQSRFALRAEHARTHQTETPS